MPDVARIFADRAIQSLPYREGQAAVLAREAPLEPVEAGLLANEVHQVGRIAAIHDRNHNEAHRERTAFFGLFESFDDPETAKALVDAAYAELNEVAKKHEDAGMLAVALLTLDVAIKNSET